MTPETLKLAHALFEEIGRLETRLAAYRKAGEFIVGLKPNNSPRDVDEATTLSAAEVGDAIVAALERRIAAKREALRQHGVNPA
jgi:hypothetical protein